MPMCVLFLIWAIYQLIHQIFLLLNIFGTFEADLKMFKKSFLFNTQKLPKNSNLLKSVWISMGVLSPPPTTVQCAIVVRKIFRTRDDTKLDKISFELFNHTVVR